MLIGQKKSDPQEGYTIVAADYNNVKSVTSILQDNKVSTLICAIGVLNEKANTSQLSLIQAASQSCCTNRFVIGSFDMEYKREYGHSMKHGAHCSVANCAFPDISRLSLWQSTASKRSKRSK